jgi:uncharacterized membrane protein
MNKNLLLGVALVIFVTGMVVMIASDSISFADVVNSMSGLSPRLLSLVVLPFIVVLIVVGNYLRKKNEERRWKEALLKTRAKKQNQKEAARKAAKDKQHY